MRYLNIGFLVVLATISYGECYKILGIFPFPVLSHYLWVEHFLQELLNRGHELTLITNFKMKQSHPNLTEVIIDPMFDVPAKFPKHELFEMKYAGSDWINLNLYINVGYLTTAHALENKKIQQFIAREDLEFDIIFAEQFFQEAFLMFSHKYNVPIVTIGTIGFADYMDRAMGALTPWSFVPHTTLDYSDDMTFSERAYNTYLSCLDMFLRHYVYFPKMDDLARKYFASYEEKYGPLPSVKELEKRVSVMLINSHPSTSHPRPLLPGQISVAGGHIHPPKKLPSQIQEFLDGATNGAIFFSLGTYIQGTDVPRENIKMFLDVFSKLKQRVLWKFEDNSLDLPPNVMVQKWMPQSDILAHKNIVLFITHGGMFGTQEGLFRGVPMLFIPFYGDQMRNGMKSTAAGYAQTLRYMDVNKSSFTSKLNELLSNKTYYNNAKKASSLFRDNPIPPLDEAMYWIEYVARHNGAPHLKSAARNLPWYKYLLLDLLAIVFAVFFVVAFIVYKLINALVGGKKEQPKNKSNNKISKSNKNKKD